MLARRTCPNRYETTVSPRGSRASAAAVPAERSGGQQARTTASPAAPQPNPGPTLSPISELPNLDLAARVGTYLATDAVWVPGQPLAVNRDFDFATAMTMEGIGPALAAAKRKKDNDAFAARLSALPTIDPIVLLHALCAPPGAACETMSNRTARIYGLLFGEHGARLQVFVDVEPTPTAPALSYAAVTAAARAPAYLEHGALEHAFTAALAVISPALALPAARADQTTPSPGRCAIGDQGHIDGALVGAVPAQGRHALIVVSEGQGRLLCPQDAFTAMPAPSP